MQRREFVTFLGSIAAGRPLAALAQQRARVPRIGFLTGLSTEDIEGRDRRAAFQQGLAESGWRLGRNLEIDYRAAGRDPERHRQYAEELVALAPEVLLAGGATALTALQQVARRLPIVFANVTDPAGAGYLARLARPARNITGFMNFEPRFGWKLLELLMQLAPRVTRVAILRKSESPAVGHLSAMQAVAPRYGVELTVLGDHDAREIERGFAAFVHGPNHGLIVTSLLDATARVQIVDLAALYRLPTVYAFRRYVVEGGLISYGTNQAEPYRQAAGYVDRILRGELPIDLPVQAPVKYETVLNLKAAHELGLAVPDVVRQRIDEVIES